MPGLDSNAINEVRARVRRGDSGKSIRDFMDKNRVSKYNRSENLDLIQWLRDLTYPYEDTADYLADMLD